MPHQTKARLHMGCGEPLSGRLRRLRGPVRLLQTPFTGKCLAPIFPEGQTRR
jgi:hypothetical protein